MAEVRGVAVPCCGCGIWCAIGVVPPVDLFVVAVRDALPALHKKCCVLLHVWCDAPSRQGHCSRVPQYVYAASAGCRMRRSACLLI